DKPVQYFERKQNCIEKLKNMIQTVSTVKEKALKASYKVAIRITKARKPHTIAETFLIPAVIEMCCEMLGHEADNKLKNVPVSNDTLKITDVAPFAKATHCMLHRENLVMRKMADDLKHVLEETIKVVNFIKAHPFNAHNFSVMCLEMGELHHNLLLHIEVRWLSNGKVLNRVFELRESLKVFLQERMRKSAGRFLEENWLA
ncbi:SCND3 protein, partial [Polyodon spathula]|nr:SCND3 protein [Polyodon spathula]